MTNTNTTAHPINDLTADAAAAITSDFGIDPDSLSGPPAGVTSAMIDDAVADHVDHVLLMLADSHADNRDVANLLAAPNARIILTSMVKDRINHTNQLTAAFRAAGANI